MQYCALVVAITLGCISERFQHVMVRSEHLECLLSLDFHYDDHVSAHKETGISDLLWLVAAVVEYLEIRVLGIL